MHTGEAVRTSQEECAVYDLSPSETIAQMEAVSRHDVSQGSDAWRRMFDLTDHLVETTGMAAEAEYQRYNMTAERRLNLDTGRLIEKHQGKTVLVTGGTGLIGSALLKELEGLGAARLVSVSRGQTETFRTSPQADYRFADLRDKDELAAIFEEVQPDMVYHVAADKYNHEAEKRARHTLTTNIQGTLNVLEAAQATGVEQVVYASTGKAARPFSPDIYASSKKVGEWLMSRVAEQSDTVCSVVRFTHVVDDSNIRKRMHEWATEGEMMTLQGPDVWFYVQSAQESAQLLLNSTLEAEQGKLHVQAIRELGMPINLLELGVGVLQNVGGRAPIKFQGAIAGYEDKAWPLLFGLEAGDFTPLINTLETHEARPSQACPEIDTFPLEIAENRTTQDAFDRLLATCHVVDQSSVLRKVSQELSWHLLNARLNRLPETKLQELATRVGQYAARSSDELSEEHARTNQAVLEAASLRTAVLAS